MVGSLKIYVPGPGGYQQIDGSKFYDARYWEPEKYQQWHDAIWQQPRIGRVTVGEVEQTAGPAVDSRVPATAPAVDAAAPEAPEVPADANRSDQRSVGKERVGNGRSLGAPKSEKNKN